MKNPRSKIALALGIALAAGGLTLTGLLGGGPVSAAQGASHGVRLADGTRLPADAVSVAFDRLSGPTTGGGQPGGGHNTGGHATSPSQHGVPRVTGTAKAGSTVGVVAQSFKALPKGATRVVTWYVDGKVAGHGTKLKLKSSWKSRKLVVEVAETWTTKVKKHGRTLTQHQSLSARSKAAKIR